MSSSVVKSQKQQKPHAVVVTFPAQGHINPILKLAKLLHHRGFHITFVNSEYNHKRLLKSRGPHALDGLPSFRFESIPDGLPESDDDVTQSIALLCKSVRETCLPHFKKLLTKLSDEAASSDVVPPVTCLVSDGLMGFTVDVAEELGIPVVLYWSMSAGGFWGYHQYSSLIEKGHFPLKDASYLTNGYMDTVIDWIPGFEGIRLKDFPSFIRKLHPLDEIMIQTAFIELRRALRCSATILNTIAPLEKPSMDALSPIVPPIYALGPFHLLTNEIQDESLSLIESNLWKEDSRCLEWLNTKKKNSVLYVNYGSITVMTPDQMVEFAWGLANSNMNFLWIIRPDLVAGSTAVLPPEFVEVTKERGLLASWCPQEQVLAHPSVGGFLTHSGWNSTIESITCGVPMICWPFFAEQPTNSWLCTYKWGIGMEMDADVKRERVEVMVRELMVGEKGKKMKKKAIEWKKVAEQSVSESFANLDKLITQVLLSSPTH